MLDTLKNLVSKLNPLTLWERLKAASWKVKLGLVLCGACLVYAGLMYFGLAEFPTMPALKK